MLNKYGWRQPVIRMAQPGVEPLDLEIRCKITTKKAATEIVTALLYCYRILSTKSILKSTGNIY